MSKHAAGSARRLIRSHWKLFSAIAVGLSALVASLIAPIRHWNDERAAKQNYKYAVGGTRYAESKLSLPKTWTLVKQGDLGAVGDSQQMPGSYYEYTTPSDKADEYAVLQDALTTLLNSDGSVGFGGLRMQTGSAESGDLEMANCLYSTKSSLRDHWVRLNIFENGCSAD
jgi:hypothetical protein